MAHSPLGRIVPVLGLLLFGSSACADRTGDGPDAVPEDEVEPLAYCPERSPAPLMEVEAEIGAIRGGACGDLIYAAGDARYWYQPGLGSVEVDADPWTARFAPTGHLFAWKRELADGLMLADARRGEWVELESASSFGLVPAPGTEHGADLWTCRGGSLELAGPEATAVLADEVACASVTSSTGSPRVVFADTTGAVFVADLESLESWSVAGAVYEEGSYDEAGYLNDDRLWIDHDGRVVVHHEVVWESDPESDADWEVIEGAGVYVDGELDASWGQGSVPYNVFQAPKRGAPVILRPGGGLLVYSHGEAHALGGDRELGPMALDRSGRAVIVDEGEHTLLRIDEEGTGLELLAEGVEAQELLVSAAGSAIALVELDPECGAEPPCSQGHRSVRVWREGEGLASQRSDPGLWDLAAITDAGQVLALRDGLDTDPSEVVLFDAGLARLADYPILAEYGARARTVSTLADGRVLAEFSFSGGGVVLLADPSADESARLTALSSGPVEIGHVFLDASEQALAFVEEDTEGIDHLLAGQLPG